jgi:hypothetical protein
MSEANFEPLGDWRCVQRFAVLWEKVERDQDGKRALDTLRRDGFRLKFPIEIFATIPFLPNTRAKSRRVTASLSGARTTIRFLRELEKNWPELRTTYRGQMDFGVTADSLKEVVSHKWVATEINTRASAITVLQNAVRRSTGKPHYREMLDLLESIFRVAGTRFDITDSSLRKLATRNEASTRAAVGKLKNGKPAHRLSNTG